MGEPVRRPTARGHKIRPRTAAPADAVAALSVFVVLLTAIPSKLIVGPLGGAGTPAQILGMAMAGLWVLLVARGASTARARVAQPLRIVLVLFAAAVLASYVAATTRPIGAAELRSADLGLLLTLGWLGVAFCALDAVPTRERLDRLLRRLVLCAAAMAVLGLVQYGTGLPWTNYIHLPGLSSNSTLVSVYGRGGFARPASTALHPIEFGAVLTMVLPFALHYAFTDVARGRLARWWPVGVIGFAIPISISRSALVATLVVLLVLVPTWQVGVRRAAYGYLVVVGGVLFVFVHGLLGTLLGLFTGISTDSSAQSRTDSYSLAWKFVRTWPVFGRGFPTFLPEYRILDNQYLGLLIDTGFVGLTAFVALLVTAITRCRISLRNQALTPAERSLTHSFVASIACATVSFALFDAFSFPMAAGLLFLIVGASGSLHRLTSGAVEPPARRLRNSTPAH